VFVDVATQHVMFIRHIVIWGMAGSTNGMIFEEKKSYWTQNVCFDLIYKLCLKCFSF